VGIAFERGGQAISRRAASCIAADASVRDGKTGSACQCGHRRAFPPVYFELLRSTGEEDFKRLPALLALPLSIFIDWDRAKSARHELVDAYLYSLWPPADLLLVSIAAGVQGETLHRLAGTHRGRDYLAAIDRDSHRLEPAEFEQIQDCLKRVGHRY
jgi:hypothetical protein